MNLPLDGSRLKIIRAQEHLDSLQAEIGMYLNEQAYEIFSQPDMSLYAERPLGYAVAHRAMSAMSGQVTQVLPRISSAVPPFRLSTIIGDCVTNTRAALDYIVFELAQRFFKPPLDLTDNNHRRITSYPIDPKSKDLQSRLDALQKHGVPAAAIEEIKATHPQNAGYESLGWLHELVNRDKHRMPLLTTREFHHVAVSFPSPLWESTASIHLPRNQFTTDGRTAFQSNMQMYGKVAFYVTWKDIPVPLEPVERTLEQIIKTAANIIPRFDRFFV